MSPTAQVIKTARVLARAKSHPCLASILSPPCIRKTESYLYLRCILGKCPQRQGPEWHELLLSVEAGGGVLHVLWLCLFLPQFTMRTTDGESIKTTFTLEGGWWLSCCDFARLPPLCPAWQAAILIFFLLPLILL